MSTHYKPTTGDCIVCAGNCKTCETSDDKCLSCDNDDCTDYCTLDTTNNICHDFCLELTNETTCKTCNSTKYNSGGHCLTLPSNAVECTYHKDGNKATKC